MVFVPLLYPLYRDAFSLAFIRQWDVKLEGERLPPYLDEPT